MMRISCALALLLSTACASTAGVRDVTPPSAPAAGTDAVLDGTLQVLVEDSNQGSRTVYFLMVGDRRVPVRFSRSPNLLTGAHIRVQGQWGANGEFDVASFEVAPR